MNIQGAELTRKEIATALAKPEEITSVQAQHLITACVAALTAVASEVAATRPRDGQRAAGPLMAEALASGTREDVDRLAERFKTAALLEAQLQEQRKRLDDLRTRAKVNEAELALPLVIEDFALHAAAVRDAVERLQDAVAQLERTGNLAYQARGVLRQAGRPLPPGPPQAVFESLADLPVAQAFHLGSAQMRPPAPADWPSLVGEPPPASPKAAA